MIIDLRGNIGGDLDFPQAFLGLFIGPNQYAFDLTTKATTTQNAQLPTNSTGFLATKKWQF